MRVAHHQGIYFVSLFTRNLDLSCSILLSNIHVRDCDVISVVQIEDGGHVPALCQILNFPLVDLY